MADNEPKKMSVKIRRGTVLLAGNKTATVGESVEVTEAEAKAHPDVYETGGEQDERLTPDDGTDLEKMSEDDRRRLLRQREEAIRYEAATTPAPPPEGDTNPDQAAAQATVQTEAQRAETERQGLLGRIRHRRGGGGGGGETGGTPEGGGGGGGG
jgi:hypothetical protein